MIKISVVIPVYNAAKYLPKCLESICNQTLSDLEIICVNDCSTDDSFLILQKYAKSDERIKLIDLKKNKGAAAARNLGVKNACGQYLGFVDADDFIDQNFYEKLYERALEANVDAVKGNITIYCPKTEAVIKDGWIDINHKVKQHKANFCLFFTSAIYKTSFVRKKSIKFLEGLMHFEDPYFTIKAALFYQKLEVIDDVFYYYVNNCNSASRKNFSVNHIESLANGLDQVLDLLDEYCDNKDHYVIVFNFLLGQTLECCNRLNVDDEVNIKAVKALLLLHERCRYKEECMSSYFLQKKQNHKRGVVEQLRNVVRQRLNNA